MWCLETIIELNKKVDEGMTPTEAYEACGIKSVTDSFPVEDVIFLKSGEKREQEKDSK